MRGPWESVRTRVGIISVTRNILEWSYKAGTRLVANPTLLAAAGAARAR